MGSTVTREQLAALVGKEVGVSDWFTVDQSRVNVFADVTLDHQFIHVDPARARATPFGGTIAHGFLTLSMIPKMSEATFDYSARKTGVNYGLNKVRFPSATPVGSAVRATAELLSVTDTAHGAQLITAVTVEREGSDKPVCVAESIARRFA